MGDHISGLAMRTFGPFDPLGILPSPPSPTQRWRLLLGVDGNVDYGSGAYRGGEYAGVAWEMALGSGGALGGVPKLMSVEEVFGGGQRSADMLFRSGFFRTYAVDAEDSAKQGFKQETLRIDSSRGGEGIIWRQYNARGNLTRRVIQFHPGGGVHRAPCVKITSPAGGIVKRYGNGYRP